MKIEVPDDLFSDLAKALQTTPETLIKVLEVDLQGRNK